MRPFLLGIVVLVLVSSIAYAASMTGTVKSIGGGTDTVPHCQVLDYDIAASDTISSINARVECDLAGNYTVTASVNSGAGSGSKGVTLAANTPATVTGITITPSVTITGSSYTADIQVKR